MAEKAANRIEAPGRIFDRRRPRRVICRSSLGLGLSDRNVEFGRQAVGKRYCMTSSSDERGMSMGVTHLVRAIGFSAAEP